MVKDCFKDVEVEIIDPLDQVNVVEQSIRTVKEGIRCIVAMLPFIRLPKSVVCRLIEVAIRNLNQFPAENGISNKYSPLTVITSRLSMDYNDILLDFGTYTEVYEDNRWITSSNRFRSTPAICLGPTFYRNPGYYFLSLVTGRILRRR